jgi:hypothetical protein
LAVAAAVAHAAWHFRVTALKASTVRAPPRGDFGKHGAGAFQSGDD